MYYLATSGRASLKTFFDFPFTETAGSRDCLQLRSLRPSLSALPVVHGQRRHAEETGEGGGREAELFPLCGQASRTEPKLPALLFPTRAILDFGLTRTAFHLLFER